MTQIYKEVHDLLKKSYPPYSNFHVACILIDKNNQKHYGVNVESVAYPSGLCAERNAIFSSVTKGLRPGEFTECHIISDKNDTVINCCGACLQVMNEFFNEKTKIFSYSNDGKLIRKTTIRDMMPFVVSSELLQ